MASPINRREHKDIPKQILLTWDLCKRSEARADELDVSYSRYIRGLITEDLKRADLERLSQEKEAKNRRDHVEILNSLNGLLKDYPDLTAMLKGMRDE